MKKLLHILTLCLIGAGCILCLGAAGSADLNRPFIDPLMLGLGCWAVSFILIRFVV